MRYLSVVLVFLGSAFAKQQATKRRLKLSKVYAVLLLCAVTAIASTAQTFTTLVTFNGSDGSNPFSSLVQGFDGNLYGTTTWGGDNKACPGGGTGSGCGTVFKISPSGTLTTLYRFCAQTNCADGAEPQAGLAQAIDGNLYGTTYFGGANNGCGSGGVGCGTVFKITPSGTLTTLYSFCTQTNCADGAEPTAGLVQAIDGNFYGTTLRGGRNTGCGVPAGCGTVFKITPRGTLTTLYSFCAQTNCADGALPQAGPVQAIDVNFYGTTYSTQVTRNQYAGTVFKITTSGTLTTLYSFCAQPKCADGANPVAALVQGTDGNFYGTTMKGGYGCGIGCVGTIFKITPNGTLTTLYRFCSQAKCTDGANPETALVQATDGYFYGTTYIGGANNLGTLFKVTSTGSLTTLYSFTSAGSNPLGALVQDTNGSFYGTTQVSQPAGGTVFRLSVGLGPFVETLPASGKVGAAVTILGTNLSGTSAVKFNGTASSFIVVSSSEIKTTVPNGATTGFVTVTNPKGTLKSNKKFHVIP